MARLWTDSDASGPGPSPSPPEDAGPEFSDEELTALALAADPDAPLADDAVPLDHLRSPGTLPQWYMAPVMVRHSGRLRSFVILGVVGAFLIIEAFGLCSTYGQVPFH